MCPILSNRDLKLLLQALVAQNDSMGRSTTITHKEDGNNIDTIFQNCTKNKPGISIRTCL